MAQLPIILFWLLVCIGLVWAVAYLYGFGSKRNGPDMRTHIQFILKDGKKHGYQIAQEMKRIAPTALADGEGRLYPTLHKMEEAGELLTETRDENGRLRRYYWLAEKRQ